jgi:hypothetical protein
METGGGGILFMRGVDVPSSLIRKKKYPDNAELGAGGDEVLKTPLAYCGGGTA